MNDSLRRPATFAIEAQKIRSYLLNVDHPVRGSKARFFIDWGFRADAPSVFTTALLAHAHTSRLIRAAPFAWGTKFVFEGPLEAPRGGDSRRQDRVDDSAEHERRHPEFGVSDLTPRTDGRLCTTAAGRR